MQTTYRTMIVRRRRSLKVARMKIPVRTTKNGTAALHPVPQAPSTMVGGSEAFAVDGARHEQSKKPFCTIQNEKGVIFISTMLKAMLHYKLPAVIISEINTKKGQI